VEWISVKDRLPPQGVNIKIKADYGNDIVEANCVFKIYDIDENNEAWSWTINEQDFNKYGTLRPTHWMSLPKPSIFPIKIEYGGNLRCLNSKGEAINMADELNRLENDKYTPEPNEE
jgi:hypothetical protein